MTTELSVATIPPDTLAQPCTTSLKPNSILLRFVHMEIHCANVVGLQQAVQQIHNNIGQYMQQVGQLVARMS